MGNRYGSIGWARTNLKLELMEINGMPGVPCISLNTKDGERYPIAAESWHKEHNGLITCPPNGDYRIDWLADCYGGRVVPGTTLRRKISQWIKDHYEEIEELLNNPEQSPDALFASFKI